MFTKDILRNRKILQQVCQTNKTGIARIT